MSVTRNFFKPIVEFDLETTGNKPETDRIVQFSAKVMFNDGSNRKYSKYINPQMPISDEAEEVHGISNEFVKNCPPFAEVSEEILSIFGGCDISGYNIINFDIPVLIEEFLRCGTKDFPAEGTKLIDSYKIFIKDNPRDLGACYKFYNGREVDPDKQHDATYDVELSESILLRQLEKHDNIDNLVELSTMGKKPFMYCNKFYIDEDGVVRFNFSDKKDKPVTDHTGFLNWMLTKDFSNYTKNVVRILLLGSY